MNFNQFVVRNTLRNKHLYLAYFLSTLFSVMIFFTFSVLAFHPSLSEGLNQHVKIAMIGASVIIYGFAFFFVMYSMGVFLQSRKKEFGLLMIQGMSPKQLRKMVFIENIVIGFFATILGSLVGSLFSQGILVLARQLFRITFNAYFPTQAILVTFVSFAVLFLLISFFIQFSLPKLNVQELLKAGELGKGKIKVSAVKSVLAILLIGGGYTTALLAQGLAVIGAFLPVVFVVILGTNFLFNQSSLFLIERIKRNERFFWKKTNMIVFSDLAFRMKDNARSFFLVAIISTVTFAAIGTLYGFQDLFLGGADAIPYSYAVYGDDKKAKDALEETLQAHHVEATSIEHTYYVNANSQYLSEKEYNKLAKFYGEPTIHTHGKVVQLDNVESENVGQPAAQSSVKIGNQTYQVAQTLETTILSTFLPTFVLPDIQQVPEGDTESTETYWLTKDDVEQQVAVGKKLQEQGFQSIQSTEYMKQTIIDSYAPVLFVGIFVGIVFFVSAGSFLYFRLYSDMESDIEKFKMIYKMGLSKKELKKMIYQQVGILFFTPIVVSLIHGAIALNAMYHVFNLSMQLAGWEVLGVFLVIQIVYYLIARVFYFRKVYRGIHH